MGLARSADVDPALALLSTVRKACSCRHPPARQARHCGSVPGTAIRVRDLYRLRCPFLTLSPTPSRKVAPQRDSASPQLATHAFQQPYDASVSEIDPMDLATPEQDQRKSIGRLTRLMARSLSIVWQSARTPFLALDWAEATQRPFPNAAGLCSAAGFDGRAGHLGEHWRSLASGAASHAAGGPDRRHCG